MEFPKNLILVRHGLSEHNLARIRSKNGNNDDWKTKFSLKHTSKYRLTDIGIEQAQLCGEFIKENICDNFDYYFTSEYTRTLETSYYLDFKNAEWQIDFTIRERDKGIFSGINEEDKKKYISELDRKNKDDFYWAPLGGESIAELCQRVDRFLEYIKKECNNKNIIIVTHGTIMEAFRMRLENKTHLDYSTIKKQKIKNCQILWYSSLHPILNTKLEKLKWMSSICPYDHNNKIIWKPIIKKLYSNDELFDRFTNIERDVNNTEDEREIICSFKNGCKRILYN